jgi:hypothetical protein
VVIATTPKEVIVKRALLVAFAMSMLMATFPTLAGEIRRLDLNANNYDVAQKYRIVISNAAAQLIDFHIAGKDGGMQKYEVAAGDVATLSDGRSTRYTIEVATDGNGVVRYELSAGRRYQIYWNDPGYRWDVVELTARE